MHAHDVVFAPTDALLVDRVVRFAKEGLQQGETVLVVATPDHRSEIKARLMAENLIGLSAPRDEAYVTLDADATLSLFLVNDWPDERVFLEVMAQVIASTSRGEPIRIYGEMVAVLWAQGRHRAAIRLEHLWNQLAQRRRFSLLCGYPSSVVQYAEGSLIREVCACHTAVGYAGSTALHAA
jgi:hypothetical protein